MAGFTCPFCNHTMAVNMSTQTIRHPSFSNANESAPSSSVSAIKLTFYKCPNCDEYTIIAQGVGYKVESHPISLHPTSTAKQYPDYIPEHIRNDYEEA